MAEENNTSTLPTSRLGQLRLLVALDTLLVVGSVQKAAVEMGLSAPAMSRLLAQIREAFDDPIFIRSGRRMLPTPKAEALRLRLRALSVEAENLLKPEPQQENISACDAWRSQALLTAPPLSLRKPLLDGQPSPQQLAQQLVDLTHHNDPIIRFSRFLGIIGRGSGNSRPLSIEEAEEAFSLILEEKIDPMQFGSFLSLIHYRGTSAQELAGMIYAIRQHYGLNDPDIQHADLDWPAYLSPNSQRAPWFMQAAKLLAQAGYKIALHGNNGTGDTSGKIEKAARALDIPVALNIRQASEYLSSSNIAYLPLPAFAPHLAALNALYPLFATRSPVGDCVHLINPLQAHSSLLGVSRPAYRELHRDTINLMLNRQKKSALHKNPLRKLNILSGNRDVAEFFPFRDTVILNLSEAESADIHIPAMEEPTIHPRIAMDSFEYWHAIWQGTAIDDRLETVITATAALGLMTLKPSEPFNTCHTIAKKLWLNRHKQA